LSNKLFSLNVQSVGKLLEASCLVDLCKLVLVLITLLTLSFVDISMVYHIIRGQAIIKLYIFYNMLEVIIDLKLNAITTNKLFIVIMKYN